MAIIGPDREIVIRLLVALGVEKDCIVDAIPYLATMPKEIKLFKRIEIETINRCNGHCKFCGVSADAKQRPFAKMSSELFHSIIDQLEFLEYDGQLSLFSNNEPFLDERIVEFAEYARSHVKNAQIVIYSNGLLLNEQRLNILDYVDLFIIDIYRECDEDEPENIKNVRNIIEKSCYKGKVCFNRISPSKVRFSRAGTAPNKVIEEPIEDLCHLPFTQIVIRPDGKVSLCCNDALGQVTMGDTTKTSLIDIWYSRQYMELREKMILGRQTHEICSKCDSIDWRDIDYLIFS